MHKGNPVDTLLSLIINILSLVFQVLVTHIIPAVFTVAVWLTELLLTQAARRHLQLTPGLIVLISVVGWVMASLLLIPVLLAWGGDWQPSVWWCLGGGVLLGLCAGGAIAQRWFQPPRYQIESDSTHLLGIHPNMLVSPPVESDVSLEELFTAGIPLGRDLSGHRR